MSRKEQIIEVSERLATARKARGYSRPRLAHVLNCAVSTYYRNENATSFPDLSTLSGFGQKLAISLDWLILGRGEMDFKSPEEQPKVSVLTTEGLFDDVKEMLDCMEQIPRLRYELLAHFHKYKEENRETINALEADKEAS